jgi:hypothetical protein
VSHFSDFRQDKSGLEFISWQAVPGSKDLIEGTLRMDLATQELDRYQELSRQHQEELKESRSAVKQFVLSQGAKPSE